MVRCDPALAWVLRLSLALLFGHAARQKWSTRSELATAIAAYDLLPPRTTAVAAWIVWLGELLAAGALVAMPGPIGPVAAIALLSAYAMAMAVNLRRGRRDLDCGCGDSGGSEPISEALVARNVLLASAAGVTLLPVGDRFLVPVDVVTIVGGVAVAATLYLATETARKNAARMRGLVRA